MQKTVITFGLISGLIVVILWHATHSLWIDESGKMNMSMGSIVGYTNMLLSLSLIFFGIRQYRDRSLDGKISFGKAFKVGFFIALVASAIYVIGWMIYFNTSELAQTFPDQYMEYMKEQWAAKGLSADEINEKSEKIQMNFENYKNPVIMAGMTLFEILPVGILVSLISALILKRK